VACALACAALSTLSRATTFVVTQSGFGFSPANITINVGDTVQWNWTNFNHTVSEGTDGVVNGNELFTFLLDAAHPTVTFTFTQAFVSANPMPGGLYHYFCEVHFPIMIGTITVNAPSTGTAYCFGDGSGTACPCGNASPVGNHEGCLSSLAMGGKLVASGTPSLAADSVILAGSQMPNSSALYFQGTTQIGTGAGAVFGDGLRCAGGTVVRLATKTNASAASQYPGAGDPSVSAKGMVGSPGSRTYQVWYRNAASFCTTSTFNLTNGYAISWTP
jgi:plastocyanin